MARTTFVGLLGFAAVAAATAVGPAEAGEPLTVPQYKTTMVRLSRPASIVNLANPNIANVTVESSQILFVLGLLPGETSLLVLDSEMNVIATYDVMVAPEGSRQVTVNRVSPTSSGRTEMVCPDRCAPMDMGLTAINERAVVTASGAAAAAPSAPEGGTGGLAPAAPGSGGESGAESGGE